MKNKTITCILTISLMLSLVACGGTTESVPSLSADSSVEISDSSSSLDETASGSEETTISSSEEEPKPEEEKAVDLKYNFLLNSSIQSTGNNYRLKRVLEKARNGETVNIATLGGSITEGAGAKTFHEGYAYLFAEAFSEAYCSGDNMNYVNAGLSGTPSSLAVIRYDKDVVKELGCEPDLLIIEFAVNDYNEATNGRALESLIYQALTANEDCAVILLFSLSMQKWSLATQMQPTGYYYSIPMVSMPKCFNTGMVSDSDYFYDEYHPAPYGHKLTCDCLMQLLKTIDEEALEEAAEIPEEARLGRDFLNMKLATRDNEEVTIEEGSFARTDTEIQQCYFKNTPSFPDNFTHAADAGNDSLKFTMHAAHIILNYKTASSNTYGEADVYVDGKKTMTLNGYDSAAWNNCNAVLVLDEEEVGAHTVEIKMAEGSEGKKFTVLGLGYN